MRATRDWFQSFRECADPTRERGLIDIAGGKGEHGENRRRIVGDQLIAVEVEKKLDRDISSALVAIDERMVASDSEAICRCKIGEVRVSVRVQIPGSGERGLQQAGIARAGTATMFGELSFVNRNDDFGREPGESRHFASSRSTARRFFMIARAAFICASKSSLCGVMR